MVQIPTTETTETITPANEAAAPVVETKKQKKAKKAAAATTATEGTTPAEPKAPAVPKVKGPNDLSAAEARALAISADGQGRINGEYYTITCDVLGTPSKASTNGLLHRGFLEARVVEPQEGQGGRTRTCFFITDAGRAALALQPDVAGLTEKAMAMEAVAKEKFLAKKAAKAAAKPVAAATTVPTEAPAAEVAAS